ncbi:hypothetical protein MERGE_002770 [Pneumocystis wakefieldiae]|uniref:NADH dehydrogenase [ubiquinone] iron-sulfur protein 5 n=1 Tax=Pneumocystis wakefieldiae TaxID=38082 RepID=A0A899G1V8_9ASCO|nr:hypothetical protein MERGE_002770 [Pneumocystis wakefieldiae]
MASGYGYSGGQSRCYPFWQQFLGCYASLDGTKEKNVCIAEIEDYIECLHHAKEIRRLKAIQHELERKASAKKDSIT